MPEAGERTEPMASSAWISPRGDFYYVPECNHRFVAEDVLHSSMDALEAEGWLHVSFVYSRVHNIYCDKPATQAQVDAIFDVAMAVREHDPDNTERFAFLMAWVQARED